MTRYRVLRTFRWGGISRRPGEIVEPIEGRRMDAMVARGAVERVVEVPAPARTETVHPEMPRRRSTPKTDS